MAAIGEGLYLFRVVDFPEEGLPTRPIKGSRGILEKVKSETRDLAGFCRRITGVWKF